VFIPAFVFNIISEAKIDSGLALQMLSFILVAQIAVALLGFMVGKALRQSREITAAFVLIATFGNVGNFGLPLIVFRLGETARTFATVYFVATVFISFVICVGVASWARSGGVTAVFSVFKTPALIALIPALVFNITDVRSTNFSVTFEWTLGAGNDPCDADYTWGSNGRDSKNKD